MSKTDSVAPKGRYMPDTSGDEAQGTCWGGTQKLEVDITNDTGNKEAYGFIQESADKYTKKVRNLLPNLCAAVLPCLCAQEQACKQQIPPHRYDFCVGQEEWRTGHY